MRFPVRVVAERRMGGLANPDDETLDAFGASPTIAGETVSVDKSLRMADVFTAVNIITEQIATLPLRVFRTLPENAVEEQPFHRMTPILGGMPNPVVPAHRFWATAAAHLLLWGNAFVEKLRNPDGLVSELWLIPPGEVTVEYNAELRTKRFVTYRTGTKEELSQDRVLHIFGVTVDGLCGMSPIQAARESLGMIKGRERFEADVYARRPFMAGVVQHPKQLKSPVRLRESWAAVYGGEGVGRHSVAVLEEGATFQQLTAPLSDMQFVEGTRMSRKQIANLFKLPAIFLNEQAEGSLFYQTVEGNKLWLASQTIAPVTTNIQKFISADSGIFPFQSWFCEFVLEALMRGEPKTRAEFYTAMFNIKDGEGRRALAVDEIRAKENLPPAEKEETAELAPIIPASMQTDPTTGEPAV